MSLLFIKSGILDSIQDLGRQYYRSWGINPNGVMDRTAARLINILLRNDENEAVLEMHFPAPALRFEQKTIFSIGGADFSAELNGRKIENWRVYQAEIDETLKFPAKISGSRAYLAVAGGFQADKWLGSASANLQLKLGGNRGVPFHQGDQLKFKTNRIASSALRSFKISASLIPFYSRFPTVRVIAGAEYQKLTARGEEVFLTENFKITNSSNRMGYRLEGEAIFLQDSAELLSSAVNFGTIQMLPNGQLIVLMADHQTSGGYPRIADIIAIDLPLAAQIGANDKIGFHLISIEEAESLLFDFEKNLNLLKIAVSFR